MKPKPDKRKVWTHLGCKVVPVTTLDFSWGKGGIYERAAPFKGRNFYWRIEFGDNSGWILGPDKAWCEKFISSTAWLRDRNTESKK